MLRLGNLAATRLGLVGNRMSRNLRWWRVIGVARRSDPVGVFGSVIRSLARTPPIKG
jgi:hypothetical protein